MSLPTREEKVTGFLRRHDLDGWLAWRPDEILLLSGHCPFWGATFLLRLAEGRSVLFVPALEPLDHISVDLQVVEYPWGRLSCADPFAILLEKVRSELKKAGTELARVGMNRNAARSSHPIQAAEGLPVPESLRDGLSGSTAKRDGLDAAFEELYIYKSDEEIERIRLANRVACVGIREFRAALQPGVSEVEVSARVEAAIQQQVGEDRIFYARGWAMIQSGPNSADAGSFNRSTARKVQKGDLVLMELATCVNGYWSDLTRTSPVGALKPELWQLWEIARASQAAAVAAARPGVSAGEIDAIAREAIAKEGLGEYFTHGTGHHVGFRYHDPGFCLTPGQTATLQEGMIVTVEPGVYVRELGGGARVEDNVLVTATGREVLSRDAEMAAS
jgi:Xaa-Pro dipeptidase